jgi:hypothetical protein
VAAGCDILVSNADISNNTTIETLSVKGNSRGIRVNAVARRDRHRRVELH